MSAAMFHEIFESSTGAKSSAGCCDHVRGVMRTLVDYTNCC